MGLREQLDVAGQRQHRPAALAEHEGGDVLGVELEAVTRRHGLGREAFDAAEAFLVLPFLVRQAI